MKRTERLECETVCVPIRAHYEIRKKTKEMTRTMDYGEITIGDFVRFLAKRFGIDLPEEEEGRNVI